MSIRAINVAQSIFDGTSVDDAAASLIPHILDTMRARSVTVEHPERADKVVREYQILWEAVGRRLIDRGHPAGLSFLLEPNEAAYGALSGGWAMLDYLNLVMDVATVTKKWETHRYADKPTSSSLTKAEEELKRKIAGLPQPQQTAMTGHFNRWRKSKA